MPPSDVLKDAIQAGHSALANSATGMLDLPYRRRIWAAYGPPKDDGSTDATQAHRRRGKLAVAAARHVQPLWDDAFPGDQRPRELIAAAEDYLIHGRTNSVQPQFKRFKVDLDNLMSDGEHLDAVYAGTAAARAFSTVSHDEILNDEAEWDKDLDPYQWDAGFYASMALGHGAPWERASDPSRRRTFWEWYLNQAAIFL